MNRHYFLVTLLIQILLILSGASTVKAAVPQIFVTDSIDGEPLPGVAVTDRSGVMIGMTLFDGSLPVTSDENYPLTLTCTGYRPLTVGIRDTTARMQTLPIELGSVDVVAGERSIAHLTCYIREISDVVSGSDTMRIFSEYVGDILTPTTKVKKFKGSGDPRLLGKRNVLLRTSASAPDSIELNSDEADLLSWAVILEMPQRCTIPDTMMQGLNIYTKNGKYGPKSIMRLNDTNFNITNDYLADSKEHRMSPLAFKLFGLTSDITQMLQSYSYIPNGTNNLTLADLSSTSMVIEMTIKGRLFKRFLHSKNDMNLLARIELYVTDREFLTVDEARKLKKDPPKITSITAPSTAAPLDALSQRMMQKAFEKASNQ